MVANFLDRGRHNKLSLVSCREFGNMLGQLKYPTVLEKVTICLVESISRDILND